MIKYCIVFVCLLAIAVDYSCASDDDDGYAFNGGVPCGGNPNTTSGVLATNKKVPPGPNTECIWSIDLKNDTVKEIYIYLKEMNLEDDDNVTLYEHENDTEPLFGPFHGRNDQVVILTGVQTLVVKLETSSKESHTIRRHFEAAYQSKGDCSFNIDEPGTVTSPLFRNHTTGECNYVFNAKNLSKISLVFESFNLSSGSTVKVNGCENPDQILSTGDLIPDLFSIKTAYLVISLSNHEDSFRLTRYDVNAECSGYEEIRNDDIPIILKSPEPLHLHNDSVLIECRKVIKSRLATQKLGIDFGDLDLSTVFDIIAVNDGPSVLSSPLLQVVKSNSNESKGNIVRTNGQYIWVAFKPVTFASKFLGNVTAHGQGGHYNGSGKVKMSPTSGNDTVFLLEVNNNETVFLNFTISQFKAPAMLKIYEDFRKTSTPIAVLHGEVWYPILSSTSKMMIIATNFNTGQFEAEFKGVTPGCMHMSPPAGDNYIVSGNCNGTCAWIIPPTDAKDKNLLLDLQYLSLDKNDEIEVQSLDLKKTSLAKIQSNVSHVPQFFIDAEVGAYVLITRGVCSKEKDIILVAHSNYLPACSSVVPLLPYEERQITSPNYPDTYPLLAKCQWNITRSAPNLQLYLAFDKVKLAPNHCINIQQLNTTTNVTYYGNLLPDDLYFASDATVQFKAVNCKNSVGTQALVSDEGFVLNVTSIDCGAQFTAKSGQFNTVPNKTICIWKVSVEPTEKDGSVNIISFNIDRKRDNENYELDIYDGSSTRDNKITNKTTSEIWSRTNTLIFKYRLLNASEPSPDIVFSYQTKSCNTSMQCSNKICLHPDWRCDGKNDCGDFSDERNCESLPVVPKPNVGVSSVTFGLTIVCFFILGVLLTIAAPRALQKYRNSQYRQFRDLSVGE